MNTSSSSFSKQREEGFTLLEVIITLVIAAILGTFLVTFMGTALTKSGEPVVRSKQMYELQQVMENIKATYMTFADATDALARLQTFVCPGGSGGICTQTIGSYRIDTKSITFIASGTDYVEQVAPCTATSGCSLKVTLTSNVTSGLSVTEVFVQRP